MRKSNKELYEIIHRKTLTIMNLQQKIYELQDIIDSYEKRCVFYDDKYISRDYGVEDFDEPEFLF